MFKEKVLYKISFFVIILLVGVLFWRINNPTNTLASWTYSDYLYRTPITYTHNADLGSARRLSITINTSTLISAGKMQSDCDDTRFTNESQKKLRYQLISGCNTASTSYDVEVLSVVNGTNTIYFYYGNNSALSESTDISSVTLLSPSGGSPASGSEESAVIPTLVYSLDEGYGTTTQDTTQQNRDGTISGALWRTEDLCVSGKCLYFDGSNDNVTAGSTISNVRTVSFWVRPITNTEQLVDLNGSAYIDSSSGTISATGFTSPTIYVNGQVSTTLVANRWQHVVVTTSTGLSASALRLGQISTNHGQIFMDEFQLYTTALSESQVKSLYNSRGSNLTTVQQGAYDQKSLSDGLVGYWPMDEASWTVNCSTGSVLDSSGNGNNGAACPNSTGPSGGAQGKFGRTGDFDGSNDQVRITNTTIIDTTQPYTISAWINMDTWGEGGNLGEIFERNGYLLFEVDDNNDSLVLYNSSNATGAETTSGALSLNTWYHVTAVYNGNNTANLYVNGTDLTSDNTITATNSNGNSFIGGDGSNNFDGRIDDLRIYNRALASSEVAQLYNWAPGPVGYWKLDENSSNTAYDSSGNDLSATSNGTYSWSSAKYGSGLRFGGGSNTYFSYTDTGTTPVDIPGSYTISSWVKLASTDTDFQTFIFKSINNGDFDENYYLGTYEDSGGGNNYQDEFACEHSYAGNAFETVFTTNFNIQTNRWYHVSCVYNTLTNTQQIYVDGALQATNASADNDPMIIFNSDSTGNLYFGGVSSEINFATYTIDGIIDNIHIYNYARTPSQIIQDMNAGHPLVGTPVAGPIAHWKFDEGYGTTANDSTPNDNNLTFSGATGSWTNDGKFSKAWNGQGSRWLTRADDSDFDFGSSQDFSLALWVKSDSASNPASSEFLVDKQIATNNPGYRVYFNTSGQLVCDIDDDTSSYPEDSVTTTQDYYDGGWHHLICIRDITKDRLLLYVDGKLNTQDTDLSATGDLSNTDSLTIGDSDATDNGSEFNGDIDELKIYRAALSATDVQTEYNQGKSLVLGALSTASDGITPSNSYAREHCIPGDTTSCDPPVLHYSFDEKTGSTIRDLSGNNNDGTITGAIFTVGKIGASLRYSTTDTDRVSLNSPNNIPANNASQTISYWFRSDANPSGPDVAVSILGSGASATQCGFRSATIRCWKNLGIELVDAPMQATRKWHHVSYTYNGTTHSLYVNGQLAETSVVSADTGTATNVEIGYNGDSTAEDWENGEIDEVKIYNYARTPAQVVWDYTHGAPIGWWKFDETTGSTAFDAAQNGHGDPLGNNGTLTNSPNRTTSGKISSAISFDGADDVINAGSASMLDNLTEMTVSAWINPTTYGENNYGRIVDKGTDPTSSSGWALFTCNDGGTMCTNAAAFFINFGAGPTGWWSTSDNSVATDQWTHLAVTYNRSSPSNDPIIYVNGRPSTLTERNTPSGTASSDAAANLLIGNRNAGDRTFNGTIDDVRIFNYILTPTQIRLVMNNDAAAKF